MSGQVGPPANLYPPHTTTPASHPAPPNLSQPLLFSPSVQSGPSSPFTLPSWADVWQLKDSHLLSLTRCQRSWEWPTPQQEVRGMCLVSRLHFLVGFHIQGRTALLDICIGSSGKYRYWPSLKERRVLFSSFSQAEIEQKVCSFVSFLIFSVFELNGGFAVQSA